MKVRALLFLALAASCACDRTAGHAHDDHGGHVVEASGPAEEDGHGHGHGHGGGIAVTDVSENTELFVEFDPLVVGQSSAFAAHLTRLADYRAVDEGTLTVILGGDGGPEERFSAPISDTPGIFRPEATPTHAGTRTVQIQLVAPGLEATHDLGPQTVYASADQVPTEEEEEEDGSISFLKEQQWVVPFMVEPARRRPVQSSIRAFGRIHARPDGEALVTATSHGRLLPDATLPSVGQSVERDERLAILAPDLETGGDVASLELAVDRAKVALDHQERELARVSGLRDRGAASDRRVAEVQLARDQAAAELRAARRRVAQFRRLQRPGSRASRDTVDLRAPIRGSVVDVRATPGAYVEDGQVLFRIVDPEALRVHALVSEAELGALESVTGAWIFVGHDHDAPDPLYLDADAIVSTRGPVDPRTHATEVLLTLPPDARVRVGQAVDVQLMHGEPAEYLTVPVGAVVHDGPLASVFVMVGGESFERRQIQPGPRDGTHVALVGGKLNDGDRVVTVGADLVALTEAAPAQAGHGHPH